MRKLFSLLFLASIVHAAPWVGFNGDSLGRGYGTGSPSPNGGIVLLTSSSGYTTPPAYLAADYPAATVVVSALNGDKISSNTAATNALSMLATATGTGFTTYALVYEFGINDIFDNQSSAAIESSIQTYLSNIRASYPGAKLVGATIQKVNFGGSSGTFEPRRLAVNTWMRGYTVANGQANGFDCICDIAANSILGDSGSYSNLTYWDADGIHLTAAGYLIWEGVLETTLRTNGLIGSAYYVRTDGSDSNTGLADSSGAAWLTIQHAASTMVAGDQVTVHAGTYAEDVTTGANGSSGAPISFVASGTVNVSTFAITKTYTVLNGFTLTGSTVGDTASSFFGIEVSSAGDNATITNCIFDLDVSNSGAVLTFGDNTTISNCTVLDVWKNGFQFAGNGGYLTGCTLSQAHSADAIHILADDIVIDGNTFDGWSAFSGQSSGQLKVGMTYYFLATGGGADFSNVGAGSPPYTLGEGNGFTATGTTPTNWGSATLDLSNHPDIIQAAASYGYASSKRCVFKNNIIKNSTAGVQFGNITDDGNTNNVADWLFYNNIISGLSRTMNLAAPGFSFYNNTFYRTATTQTAAFTMIYGSQGRANNTTIKNNLFVECGDSTSTSQGWYYTSDAVTGLAADYDLVVGTGAGTTKQSPMWREGQSGGVTNSQEAHGINGSDPVFVNAASNDFHLQSSSPAKAAGMDLSAQFTTDITGATRPTGAGTWSMGAYQYFSGGSTTTSALLGKSTLKGKATIK